MKKIKIDTYYDITCDRCGKSRSTDYNLGMLTCKKELQKYAYAEGWKCKNGVTMCPDCVKADGGNS